MKKTKSSLCISEEKNEFLRNEIEILQKDNEILQKEFYSLKQDNDSLQKEVDGFGKSTYQEEIDLLKEEKREALLDVVGQSQSKTIMQRIKSVSFFKH